MSRALVCRAAAFDDPPYVLDVRHWLAPRRRIGRKQVGRHEIDPRVGALGRQPHRDEKLVRLLVGKRADGAGIGFFEQRDGFGRVFFFPHGVTPLGAIISWAMAATASSDETAVMSLVSPGPP